MKLRNKKTGELGDLQVSQKHIAVIVGNGTSEVSISTYNSLNELNKDWYDVADINVISMPRIQDEKTRNIIRAWAKINSATVLTYNADENSLRDIFRNEIHFNRALALKDGDSYSVNELCGK